jgi:hypothetical protein
LSIIILVEAIGRIEYESGGSNGIRVGNYDTFIPEVEGNKNIDKWI